MSRSHETYHDNQGRQLSVLNLLRYWKKSCYEKYMMITISQNRIEMAKRWFFQHQFCSEGRSKGWKVAAARVLNNLLKGRSLQQPAAAVNYHQPENFILIPFPR